MKKVIGIPANGPELLDNISEHFGHCSYFVGVELGEKRNLIKVFSIRNDGHSSCMEPVMNMGPAAGTAYGVFLIPLLLLPVVLLLVVWPVWRICSKAGFHGALSLLMLVPIGNVVLLFVLGPTFVTACP